MASRGRDLNLFQKMVERDLTHLARYCHKGPVSSNLSVTERQALKVLAFDSSVVIRKSDKGGTVVVLDSEMYKNEALHHLSDISTYQKLRADPTFAYKKELSSLLDRAVHAGILGKKRNCLFPNAQ